MFSSRFMLFPTSKKKSGGGGGVEFFFRKAILSYFTFYAIFKIKQNRNVCPSIRPSHLVYWLNGRWFLQIVDIGNFIMRLEILKSASSLTG